MRLPLPFFSVRLAFLLLLSSIAFLETGAQAQVAECPRSDLGETPLDCPWAGVARALIAQAETGGPVLPLLRRLLPGVAAQLSADSQRDEWKALWGQSFNFDEGSRRDERMPIVHPAILEAMGTSIGIPTQPNAVVHAGLNHVYGYLFSTLRTSFGYKRKRWVSPALADGFRLPRGALGPDTPQGTLFSNVTYFLGRFAFRGEPANLAILARGREGVALPVLRFEYDRAPITRLVETVALPGGHRVVIRTDLVPFLNPPAGQDEDSLLLIYSVWDTRNGRAKLITAFPVHPSMGKRVTDPRGLGESQPIATRYNAFVEGVTGAQARGSRQVVRSQGVR